MKNKLFKFTIIFFIKFFSFFNLSYGVGPYIQSSEYGDLQDSLIYKINIGDNFTSGNVISSNEMNSKFLILKDIVEKMLDANNSIVPDNFSYVTSEGTKKIVLYLTNYEKTANQGGKSAADVTCNSENFKQGIEDYTQKKCNTVKELLHTNQLSFVDFYSNNDGPFYNPKGDLIANTWSNFLNLSNLDLNGFGVQSYELDYT